MLKRAGLDYWEHVDISYYDSLDELYRRYPEGEFYYLTKFGSKPHTTYDYSEREKDHFFIFGQETKGLPPEVREANPDRALRIPMNGNIRSLNLSNTAAILVYEALRQQSYPGLD